MILQFYSTFFCLFKVYPKYSKQNFLKLLDKLVYDEEKKKRLNQIVLKAIKMVNTELTS